MNSLNKKIFVGFLAALGVFLGVGFFSYQKTQDFIGFYRQILQIHVVLEKLGSILKDISDAKGSQRDFIITGDASHLEACQDSLFSINDKVRDIRKLTQDAPSQQDKIEKLNFLLVRQIDFFKQTIETRREKGLAPTIRLIQAAQGAETMDKVQQLVLDLQGEESDLLTRQSAQMDVKSAQLNEAFWMGFGATILLMLTVYLLVRREMKGRHAAEKELGERTDMLKLVLNNMMDGVMAMDAEGGFMVVNPACEKLLGIDRAQALSPGQWMRKLKIYYPDMATLYSYEELPLMRVLRGDECEDEEVFLRTPKAPSGVFLSVRGKPLKDKNGRIIGGIVVYSDITEKKKNEGIIIEDNERLKESVEKLERHNHEISILGNLVESLQACLTMEEVAKTSASMMQVLFTDTSGSILVINNSKTQVETLASYGLHHSCKPAFPTEECWAMRRSQAHLVNSDSTSLLCDHIQNPYPKEFICVPLAAQGKLVGMFHISSEVKGRLEERQKKLAVLMGEQIALAMANLKLRETLKSQSIRDALTGLYNRRYLEEAMEKELARAERAGTQLAALMIDIDHFKQFNDKFGHEAGDHILAEVGSLLLKSLRKGDVACRYGGEELTLIFPETDLAEAKVMAEKLRENIKKLSVTHLNTSLGPVTVSIGASTYPEGGRTTAEILRAADIALYNAKSSGRDRVVAWQDVSQVEGHKALFLRRSTDDKVKDLRASG